MKKFNVIMVFLLCVTMLFMTACDNGSTELASSKGENQSWPSYPRVEMDMHWVPLENRINDAEYVVVAEYTGNTQKDIDPTFEYFFFKVKEVIVGESVEETFAMRLFASDVSVNSTYRILKGSDFKDAVGEEYLLFLSSDEKRVGETVIYNSELERLIGNDPAEIYSLFRDETVLPQHTFETAEQFFSYMIDYVSKKPYEDNTKELPLKDVLELSVVADIKVDKHILSYDRIGIDIYQCTVEEEINGEMPDEIYAFFDGEVTIGNTYTAILSWGGPEDTYRLSANNSYWPSDNTEKTEEVKTCLKEEFNWRP